MTATAPLNGPCAGDFGGLLDGEVEGGADGELVAVVDIKNLWVRGLARVMLVMFWLRCWVLSVDVADRGIRLYTNRQQGDRRQGFSWILGVLNEAQQRDWGGLICERLDVRKGNASSCGCCWCWLWWWGRAAAEERQWSRRLRRV